MFSKFIRLLIVVIGIALISFTGSAGVAGAEELKTIKPENVNELIEKAKDFDGKIVELEGEIVGDIMPRGLYSWANVFDGNTTIGVWGNNALFDKIQVSGDYNFKGDTVRLKGTFRRADPSQGGELDIELKSLDVIKRGQKIERVVSHERIIRTVSSVFLATFLGILVYKRRKINIK